MACSMYVEISGGIAAVHHAHAHGHRYLFNSFNTAATQNAAVHVQFYFIIMSIIFVLRRLNS